MFRNILVVLSLAIMAGCGSGPSSPVPVAKTVAGTTKILVVYDAVWNPLENIPIIVTVHNTVDPGPIILDTVWTNENGSTLYNTTFFCLTTNDTGKISIEIDGVPHAIEWEFTNNAIAPVWQFVQ